MKTIKVKKTSDGVTSFELYKYVVRGQYYIVRGLGQFTKLNNKITKNNTEYEVLI